MANDDDNFDDQDHDGNRPLPVPGLVGRAFQDGPSTWGEFLRDWAASVSRDSAPFATVFARDVALDAEGSADDFENVIIPVTDHPETTGFHVRLEVDPNAPADTVLRVLINFDQLSGRPQIETFTRANGGFYLPGYVDDYPVMRTRVDPITVAIARVGGVAGELSTINVQVYELRRVAFNPRSKGRARPRPSAAAEKKRLARPTRVPAQQIPTIRKQ